MKAYKNSKLKTTKKLKRMIKKKYRKVKKGKSVHVHKTIKFSG